MTPTATDLLIRHVRRSMTHDSPTGNCQCAFPTDLLSSHLPVGMKKPDGTSSICVSRRWREVCSLTHDYDYEFSSYSGDRPADSELEVNDS